MERSPVRTPFPSLRPAGLRTATAALLAAPLIAAPTAAQADSGPQAGPGAPGDCLAADGATVEEERLSGDVPQEILRRSGFDGMAADFTRALCSAPNLKAAENAVRRHGDRLWSAAVARVQGTGPYAEASQGTSKGAGRDGSEDRLSAGDDRPLYWARLGMASALRRWEPSFDLADADRARLIEDLERVSRGQDDMDFPGDPNMKRVVVTGFDPFRLDGDMRRSNPSGAAALALDGAVIETEAGPAVVQTAVFPVRWRDFADGMVESALAPHYTGDRPADAVFTVSQGREGRFDLEAHNGAWRGGSDDNERVGDEGMIPIPEGAPTVTPQPQWSDSTIDRPAVVEAVSDAPFPVVDNTEVTEIPAGGTEPVTRPDGPTEGSQARAGGGGSYLSNEIAYRNTLLRDATGRDIPAGHIHTPILHFGEGSDAVTDPSFEEMRDSITEQTTLIVEASVRD
ncbi:pyroglutamyl peptidase [Nocardiopsis sp. RSe5-2]|uniref:Pyroglutamyl peptidase n=1 Tax=Nocardiopsis endophytica TaxID=3018445 RepID=A0ABT4U279_9ACTN|nr:pyroglutamyl peptidase [Nocardiopsis endophytica]MDA2811042.1 pyroglutamyl peptidase [Nocardiopsis endophytica]